IGTTGPIFPLEVNGIGQTTAALTDAGVRGGTLSLVSNSGTAGMGGAIVFGNSQSVTANSTGWAAIKGLLTNGGGNTLGDLAFSTRNGTGDTALTERMRILAGGNVGIGTTEHQKGLLLLILLAQYHLGGHTQIPQLLAFIPEQRPHRLQRIYLI
ncbi:MAG: hypothetical protein UX21_C0040G0001, partial [Microgenomates group bacterium GW2011_GWC2_45_8]